MSKTNSIVEVNGNRYDGVTGRLLNPRKPSMPGLSSGKKMIDGFVVARHKVKAKTAPVRNSAKAQVLHERAQRSSTLMRKAVKKPPVIDSANSAPQARSVRLHPVREIRAKTITRHEKVNRFGALPSTSKDTAVHKPEKVSLSAKATYRKTDAVTAPRVPSMVTSVSHQKLERMLDEALMKANAHEHMMRPNHKHGRMGPLKVLPRWLSLTVAVIVMLAIAFWLVWQNLPSVAVHVAAARSHVSATLPSYTPSGFSFAGPIKYNDGEVTMRYKGNSGQFLITQKASNWNSDSLAHNYLPADQSAQTSLVDGTTVYTYGKNNDAAWVNHGVMYSLKNNAELSSDQVLKIVQGL